MAYLFYAPFLAQPPSRYATQPVTTDEVNQAIELNASIADIGKFIFPLLPLLNTLFSDTHFDTIFSNL